MAYRMIVLLIAFSTLAGGCSRAVDDFVIPAGHPADPNGRRGVVVAGNDTLEPELLTIKPQIGPSNSAPKSAPQSGANQHKHAQ